MDTDALNAPYLSPHLSTACLAAIQATTQKWPQNDWRQLYQRITQSKPWDLARLESVALQLRPWRKGPIAYNDLHIDAEWDCTFKWRRLQPLLSSILGQSVLDIGSNNGYFTRKFKAAGARCVTGIEPTFIYTMQFIAQHCWAPITGIQTIPMSMATIHTLPPVNIIACMGVLYYCPIPEHSLHQLYQQLLPGGQLWLETLTLPDTVSDTVLKPSGPFAGIRKVTHVPSNSTLLHWLQSAGFRNSWVVDTSPTLASEQRATVWSHNHSLQPCLNRGDQITSDGYPSPNRTLICAYKLG